MPKIKVTYEVDGVVSDRMGGRHIVSGACLYRIPASATVEEIIPAFQPGWYRRFNNEKPGEEGYEYFWLTNNASTGYVDVYRVQFEDGEPEFVYDNTKLWKSTHRLFERVWFQPVDKGIADGTATAEQV